MLKLVKAGTRPGPKGKQLHTYDVFDAEGKRVGHLDQYSGESWRKAGRLRTGFRGYFYWWSPLALISGLPPYYGPRMNTRREALAWIEGVMSGKFRPPE